MTITSRHLGQVLPPNKVNSGVVTISFTKILSIFRTLDLKLQFFRGWGLAPHRHKSTRPCAERLHLE